VRRLGIVLAAGVLLAIATTRLAVHVPPVFVTLAACAVLVTASLVVGERRWAACTAAVAAGLASAHVLFRPGLPQVQDGLHVWGMWAYARAAGTGHWLPMWIPDLGAGMPLLQFYGPVSFLLIIPGVIADLAPVALWKEAMGQSGVLAALGTVLGARLLGAGWRAASIAAIAVAFSPWRLALVNYRGAVGEATAMIFAPVVAAAAIALARRPSRMAAWALGVALALVMPTHLITLFCLGVVLVPVLALELVLAREAPATRRVASLAVPSVLAAGVVAIWLVPALAEGKHTSLAMQTEGHRYFVYEEHGLDARDLLARRAWDAPRSSLKSSDRAAGMEGRQMPFYVGAVLFMAALTAPWWSRSRATWTPALGAATGLAFSTAPAAAVMTHLPLIHKIQFPWRFLTAGSILACYAIGLGVSALLETKEKWTRIVPALLLPALLIGDAAPYTGASGWVPPYRGVTHWVLAEGRKEDEPFDTVKRPVPQDWSGLSGLVRVVELAFPPDDTTTPIALFWVSYPEWMTPALYRAALSARNARDFAEFGVSRYFAPSREQPVPIAAKPYATLERGEAWQDAGPFTREPGRVALRTVVPDGGAALIVREQMFPGWEARVDGRSVPIAATPLGFMRLELPAGSHEVALAYTRRTPARRAGAIVSVVTLAIGAFVLWRRRPRWPQAC
jgi:hypothetical protein